MSLIIIIIIKCLTCGDTCWDFLTHTSDIKIFLAYLNRVCRLIQNRVVSVPVIFSPRRSATGCEQSRRLCSHWKPNRSFRKISAYLPNMKNVTLRA